MDPCRNSQSVSRVSGPPAKSGRHVYSSCHPPPLPGVNPPEETQLREPGEGEQARGPAARPGPHSSTRGRPQSGLTLLRVGLRIRLTRSRIQQLFQLQSQGLRPRHGHRVTVGAALVKRAARDPRRTRLRTTSGALRGPAFSSRVGNFREARAGGAGRGLASSRALLGWRRRPAKPGGGGVWGLMAASLTRVRQSPGARGRRRGSARLARDRLW